MSKGEQIVPHRSDDNPRRHAGPQSVLLKLMALDVDTRSRTSSSHGSSRKNVCTQVEPSGRTKEGLKERCRRRTVRKTRRHQLPLNASNATRKLGGAQERHPAAFRFQFDVSLQQSRRGKPMPSEDERHGCHGARPFPTAGRRVIAPKGTVHEHPGRTPPWAGLFAFLPSSSEHPFLCD